MRDCVTPLPLVGHANTMIERDLVSKCIPQWSSNMNYGLCFATDTMEQTPVIYLPRFYVLLTCSSLEVSSSLCAKTLRDNSNCMLEYAYLLSLILHLSVPFTADMFTVLALRTQCESFSPTTRTASRV
jgi:hypothetical protein